MGGCHRTEWSGHGRHVSVTKGHKETFGVMNVFTILIVAMVSQMYTHVKTYQIVLSISLLKITPS